MRSGSNGWKLEDYQPFVGAVAVLNSVSSACFCSRPRVSETDGQRVRRSLCPDRSKGEPRVADGSSHDEPVGIYCSVIRFSLTAVKARPVVTCVVQPGSVQHGSVTPFQPVSDSSVAAVYSAGLCIRPHVRHAACLTLLMCSHDIS